MTFSELISVTSLYILYVVFFFIFGLIIWQFCTRFNKASIFSLNLPLIIGTSLLIGIGSFTTLILFIGLIYKFNLITTILCFTFTIIFILHQRLSLLLLFKKIVKEIKYSKEDLIDIFQQRRASKIFIFIYSILLVLIISAILSTLYLSALQFPFVSDELSYHLPQAEQIVKNEKIDSFFGGHYFYGSIPKLLEVLFALGILVYGLQFTHLFHLTIYLGFLLIAFGFTSTLFDRKTGLLAVLFITFVDEFRTNAMIAFIDAGTTSFEIGALMLFILWISKKKSGFFYLRLLPTWIRTRQQVLRNIYSILYIHSFRDLSNFEFKKI